MCNLKKISVTFNSIRLNQEKNNLSTEDLSFFLLKLKPLTVSILLMDIEYT